MDVRIQARGASGALHYRNTGASDPAEAGFSATGTNRIETGRMLKVEAVRWGAVVKSTGFRGD